MFRRTAKPYGAPRPPQIWGWLFSLGVGSVLLTMVGRAIYSGQFTRRRSRVLTAEGDPFFFWIYMLFFGTCGLLALYLAFSQFKEWRRETRTRRLQ